jgi:hypothetical protein
MKMIDWNVFKILVKQRQVTYINVYVICLIQINTKQIYLFLKTVLYIIKEKIPISQVLK